MTKNNTRHFGAIIYDRGCEFCGNQKTRLREHPPEEWMLCDQCSIRHEEGQEKRYEIHKGIEKAERDTQLPAMVYPLKFYKNHYYEACAQRKNRPIPPEEEKIGYEFAFRVKLNYARAQYWEVMHEIKFNGVIKI